MGTNSYETKLGTISFFTDPEGDYALWERYIELSKVLYRSSDGLVRLVDGAHFVFGGDVVDHLPGDLRLLDELVALKDRYPDRVTLIIGNRDANKLRFNVELTDAHATACPLRDHTGVYWATGSPSQKLAEKDLEENTLATRLKWILANNMGAPKAFEARREELAKVQADGQLVTDDAVVSSFQAYARPGGSLFKFLQRARLAALIGDTLFVHGCLPRGEDGWAPGWIPGPPHRQGLPVRDWLDALEAFRADNLKQCEEADIRPPVVDAWSRVGGYQHPQPGSALAAYAMVTPDGVSGEQPTIISKSWLDNSKQPIMMNDAMLTWLQEGGVRRVVCGHQPHGDAPLVLRMGNITIITADITYAHDVLWEIDGERLPSSGKAACEVLLNPENTTIHGFLSNDMAFESQLDDCTIGSMVSMASSEWRVKGRVEGRLLLSKSEGRAVINRFAEQE